MNEIEFDQVFDALEVEVEAFAICEIGETCSLQCEPHDEILLHFVLKGQGHLECQYGRYQLLPGAIAIVPKHLRKALSGAGPIQQVRPAEPSCVLSENILRFRATDRESDLVLGCAVLKSSITRALPIFGYFERPIVSVLPAPATESLFAAMLKEASNPRAGSRAFLSAIMKQLVIVLLRSDLDNQGPLASAHSTRPKVSRAASMIVAHPGDPHTIKTLAAEAGMSRGRFIEHFSAAYGCTPMAFVQSARLTSAATMLKRSDLPVKSIAAAVGYASRSQFSKAFRDKHGQNPSAFRRGSR